MEIESVNKFINDFTGLSLHFEPWMKANGLPVFLSNNFNFYSAEVDHKTILAIDVKNELRFTKLENTVTQLRKYEESYENFVFILTKPSPYLTKKLIDQKMAFVVVGRQIYAPFLGTFYSQKARSAYNIKEDKKDIVSRELSPSTLLVFLFHVQQGFNHMQTEITSSLNISRMTLYRAYKELYREEMILMNEKNRKMSLPADWKSNFRKNSTKFKNPIRNIIFVEDFTLSESTKRLFFKSSDTALYGLTDLAEPINESYAIAQTDWKKIQSEFKVVPSLERDSVRIEIWSIQIPNNQGIISPLALYVSMNKETDDRAKIALEQMLDEALISYD